MKKDKNYDKQKTDSLDRSVASDSKKNKEHRMNWPAALIMFAGVLMMSYGIFRGEMLVVFQKAIQICLECIGIG